MEWAKHVITGKDNTTVDVGRVSWIVCLLAVIIAALGNWISKGVVDLGMLWQALTGVSAGHGIAIGAKGHTEPDPQ